MKDKYERDNGEMTRRINRLCGDNKTISLGRVKSITGQKEGVGYSELKEAVDRAIEDRIE